MSETLFTVEAVFENGILRPIQPLPLAPQQRVLVTIQGLPQRAWPADTAAIYQEIADEDRHLANAHFPLVEESWPPSEEQRCSLGL